MDDIGCEQALKQLMAFVDRELSDGEHELVERHLRTCRSCCSRMEFERHLKTQLSALSTEEVPPAARARVLDLLRRF